MNSLIIPNYSRRLVTGHAQPCYVLGLLNDALTVGLTNLNKYCAIFEIKCKQKPVHGLTDGQSNLSMYEVAQ